MTPIEATQAIEDRYRAAIVRKLRAEADRIDAGGKPVCYAVGIEDDCTKDECGLTVEQARSAIVLECDRDDGWPEGTEYQSWGVTVAVEWVVCTEHHADLSKRFSAIQSFALVDSDTSENPTIGIVSCGDCDWEGPLEPGERCPGCEDEAAMTDFGRE